jgi:hypothetical protein
MFLHKFKMGEHTVYMEGGKSKPNAINLKSEKWEWLGSTQATANLAGMLKDLSFSQEEGTKEEEPEQAPEAEQTPEQVKQAKKLILDRMDFVACKLQDLGRQDIALAIDQISDHIEGREANAMGDTFSIGRKLKDILDNASLGDVLKGLKILCLDNPNQKAILEEAINKFKDTSKA